MILVKKALGAVPSKVKDAVMFEESCWCEIPLKDSDRLYVGGIYRSPNSNDENNKKLNEALSSLSSKNHVLIMGDFNHPEINWIEETTPTSSRHKASEFMEAVRDSFLIQHVKQPTHFRGDQTPNLLDLVFTSEEGMINKIEHDAPLGKSHHQILNFKFVCYTEQAKKTPRPNYNKGDYIEMRNQLKRTDWEDMKSEGVEGQWKTILDTINQVVESCVPKSRTAKQTDKKRLPLWTNEKALTKVKKKGAAYKRYKETREGKDYLAYAKARNQAKQECRNAVRNFEKQIASEVKRNPKAFYSYASTKLKTKDTIADLEDEEGNIVTSNTGKAEVLNNFFCSVFTKENTDTIPNLREQKLENTLKEIKISVDQVKKKLKALKVDKSPGPDGVHPRVLREAADELAIPLTMLFNKSLEEGRLPQIWKDATVTPIFKKGDRSSPGNYRPVSLTCILCKLMESLVRDKVIEHMLKNDLLSKHQHGFVSGRSSATNLLAVMDAWTEALDDSTPVDAIYLDFAKAFDSVPHERLIKKLEGYGIRGGVVGWIRTFLSGRRQQVRVNGEVSGWKPVTSGIPQGSVLGPALFVIFINDLPEAIQSLVEMFADDTKIFAQILDEDSSKTIQNDIHSLTDWATTWQLRFNASKCKTLHLGNKNPQHTYKMKNQQGEELDLETTELEKDLGINIDPSLKFTKHTEGQVNKANRIMGLIRRSYQHLDGDSFKQLFTALVRPHLEYCNVAWSPRLIKDKSLIESVLRRGTKFIPGYRDMEYKERLKKIGLPSMAYRRARGDVIEAYKYTHGLYNTDQILEIDNDNTRRGHNYKLKKRHCKTATRSNFFSFRVVDIWNNLPHKVVNAPSLNAFKARIDRLWDKYKFLDQMPLPHLQTDYDTINTNEEAETSSQADA